MKKIFTLLFIASSISSFAQKIKVSESKENVGNGSNNALVVTIFEAKEEDVKKEWKSLMKKYNAKVDMGNEIFADNAKIKSIADNNTIDIYAKTQTKKDGEIELTVAFDLGGAYLNSSDHGSQFKEAKQIVYDFAAKMTKESIDDQLKEAEKILRKFNNQQEDLVKDKTGLEKDIENYKEKIKKAEDDIVKNKGDQENKKKEIETQSKVVEDIKKKQADH